MKLLGLSGSLRASSSNTAMLRAVAALALSTIVFTLVGGRGNIPRFNLDLDGETVSPLITDFRASLRAADAVIFSLPEYAHGVPGVLKNAVDWVAGREELAEKPVVLLNPTARGTYAQASRPETLTVMAAKLVPEAAVTLQAPEKPTSEDSVLRDAEMSAKLAIGLKALLQFVEAG
ncbi:MAG: NAD(P)H-dependent oxidoreductase [Acidobacteria bacterium]|nr:NAD(P)H-dependent oxidoreductase [Acidobacteriota bacterium]